MAICFPLLQGATLPFKFPCSNCLLFCKTMRSSQPAAQPAKPGFGDRGRWQGCGGPWQERQKWQEPLSSHPSSMPSSWAQHWEQWEAALARVFWPALELEILSGGQLLRDAKIQPACQGGAAWYRQANDSAFAEWNPELNSSGVRVCCYFTRRCFSSCQDLQNHCGSVLPEAPLVTGVTASGGGNVSLRTGVQQAEGQEGMEPAWSGVMPSRVFPHPWGRAAWSRGHEPCWGGSEPGELGPWRGQSLDEGPERCPCALQRHRSHTLALRGE